MNAMQEALEQLKLDVEVLHVLEDELPLNYKQVWLTSMFAHAINFETEVAKCLTTVRANIREAAKVGMLDGVNQTQNQESTEASQKSSESTRTPS